MSAAAETGRQGGSSADVKSGRKTVAIHQPNYLPWLGYFRKIARSDVFVFFDNVQMPIGKSLVTRNKLRTAAGALWLTVPTRRSSDGKPIAETPIVDGGWARKHLKTLELNYSGSPWLQPTLDIMKRAFDDRHETIADLNVALIQEFARFIGLPDTLFMRATDMALENSGAQTIVEILEKTGATNYLTGSGSGSMRHLDVEDLSARGIKTDILSTQFAEYPQKFEPFEANLSFVDALLNIGPDATVNLLD